MIGYSRFDTIDTRLATLEEAVCVLMDKLITIEKMSDTNFNKIERLFDLVCEDSDRLDNLESTITEFDIPADEGFIVNSLELKLNYIIKLLENLVDSD